MQKTDFDKLYYFLEHYAELTDAVGCTGCAFYDREEWENPCRMCKRNNRDFWRRKKDNG